MKNAELDKLTERAEAVTQELPPMYLTGEGHFVLASDTSTIVPGSEVLEMLTRARRHAFMLANTLRQTPRRRVSKAETTE